MNGLTFATIMVYYIYLFFGVVAIGIAGIVIGLLMKFVFWAEEKLKEDQNQKEEKEKDQKWKKEKEKEENQMNGKED